MARLIAVFLLILAVKAFVVDIYHDVSASMEDTLQAGDWFLVLKCRYDLRVPFVSRPLATFDDPVPTDIVILAPSFDPGVTYVKRVVAVGGQTIAIDAKRVTIDGVPEAFPATAKHADPELIPLGDYGSGKRDFFPALTLPDTKVFLMGDNRDYSFDSRIWGPQPRDTILGKVLMILWSIDPDTPWTRPLKKYNWNRFFRRIH